MNTALKFMTLFCGVLIFSGLSETVLIIAWRHSCIFFENLAEIKGIFETKLFSDFIDLLIFLGKQEFCFFNPGLCDIVAEPDIVVFFKKLAEIVRTYAEHA